MNNFCLDLCKEFLVKGITGKSGSLEGVQSSRGVSSCWGEHAWHVSESCKEFIVVAAGYEE